MLFYDLLTNSLRLFDGWSTAFLRGKVVFLGDSQIYRN